MGTSPEHRQGVLGASNRTAHPAGTHRLTDLVSGPGRCIPGPRHIGGLVWTMRTMRPWSLAQRSQRAQVTVVLVDYHVIADVGRQGEREACGEKS